MTSIKVKSRLANMAPSTVTAMIALQTAQKTAGAAFCAMSCTLGSDVKREVPNRIAAYEHAPTPVEAPTPKIKTDLRLAKMASPS